MATVRIPILRAVDAILHAISPLFAISSFLNITVYYLSQQAILILINLGALINEKSVKHISLVNLVFKLLEKLSLPYINLYTSQNDDVQNYRTRALKTNGN